MEQQREETFIEYIKNSKLIQKRFLHWKVYSGIDKKCVLNDCAPKEPLSWCISNSTTENFYGRRISWGNNEHILTVWLPIVQIHPYET